ncbi:major facilitator superfamily domain-containing protein [Crucibulum laeve]|uniref:Major facilitator superfamily domain-containing protein n=1 Tax=Crucibulum laeve TaxID=68775 RepID=A0A5C3LMT6_9AGAR|nr:major facilitator superfamily domain-containing protein [Crucibulum laeve]
MAESPTKTEQDWEKTSGSINAHTDDREHPVDDGQPMPVDAKVRRKVDLNLIPLIAILYLCSFLDRGNIGNARVAGMGTDLHLTGIRYQLAAAVFFIPYSLMEIPCNVFLKLLRPSVWIPSIMLAWGIVMMCMAFVKSYHGLIITRVFLGLAEAGLPPGVAFYITFWYRRQDQARPISLYFSSATVAGAFGGLLAFAIEKLDGRSGLRGWAWIFLLEGLLTIFFALVAFWMLPDYPSTAKFLTPSEKSHLVEALRRDNAGEPSHFEMRFIWEVLREPKSWLQTIIYLGMVMPLYAFSLFLPTIINALGFTASQAQLLTIPPYALGCLCTIMFGMLSDRAKLRGPFVMGCSVLGIIGYSMLYATSPTNHPGAGYAGAIIAACGVFPTVPLMLAWGSGNAGSSLKKAVIIGLLSGIGNLGGICSSFIYRTQDTPRFHLGHGIVLGFLSMAFIASAFATFIYHRLNKAKEVQCLQENIHLDRRAEFSHMGTNSPLFRYAL